MCIGMPRGGRPGGGLPARTGGMACPRHIPERRAKVESGTLPLGPAPWAKGRTTAVRAVKTRRTGAG
ncbi:hypothetical protein DA2_3323 [Desulfovibrio sp. A2]|nr:hypothetical protein DA2_3323 [Desulfovibrio sp. A2]